MSSRPSSLGQSARAEFRLIEEFRKRFGRVGPRVVQGIGDDTAVVRPPSGSDLLVTSDLLIEGIHFRLHTAAPADIGYRAAVANLSDIAAMGGVPAYILVTVAIPPNITPRSIMRLYRGLMEACRPHGVQLIGGDTSASVHGLFLSITVTGYVPRGRALTRAGARVGDLIYVTGTLGDSLAGLQLLENGRGTEKLSSRARTFLISRHRRPSARLTAGRTLIRHGLATAAIDVSDGLSGDLSHICAQSKVGAEIVATSLPLSPACRAYAAARKIEGASLALQGGEDYELLFTVPPSVRARAERLGRRADPPWTCIGVIKPDSFGLRLRHPDGSVHPLPATSYEHRLPGRSRAREVPCSP